MTNERKLCLYVVVGLYLIALALQPTNIGITWLIVHDLAWYGLGAWLWSWHQP